MPIPTEDELEELFAWGKRVAEEAGLTEERLDSIVRKVRALSADPAWHPAPDFLEAFLRHAVERREMVARLAQLCGKRGTRGHEPSHMPPGRVLPRPPRQAPLEMGEYSRIGEDGNAV